MAELRPGTGFQNLCGPEESDFRRRIKVASAQWDAVAVNKWEQAGHIPRECFETLGKEGFFRERWAEGRKPGLLLALVLSETLAMVSAGLGLAVTLHSEVFLGVLSRAARDNEQRALLQAGLRGEAIGCFAVTEATGGSDVAAVNTTARRTRTGWHIHGEKRYVSNGGRATHALVLAQMDGYVNRNALTLFIVPLRDPGVTIPGFFPKLGTNSCDAAHIVFDGEFSESTQLGPPGGGMLLLMEALQYERMAVSAQLVAVAQASMRLAAAWARKRQQFGTRLLALQAIRHRLADVWAEILAVEALLALTVRSAIEGTDVGRATAALKLRCAAVTQKAVDEAMQILWRARLHSQFST